MAAVTRPLSVKIDSKVFPAVGDRAENLVLRNIDFQVEPGSFVIITGPSGGGKSTLLNIIAGLDQRLHGHRSISAATRPAHRLRLPVAAAAALAHGLREHRAGAAEGRSAPRQHPRDC